jgi:hypothetical protein
MLGADRGAPFVPSTLLTAGAVPAGEARTLELKSDGCRA